MNTESRRQSSRPIPRAAALLLLGLVATTTQAAAPATAAATLDPATTWREECGSCHVPYPARFLPASAWQQLLDGLDHHFGVDASLTPAPLAAIRRHLGVGAPRATPAQAGAALPRITTSSWFRREHDEIGAAAFRRVRSAANCEACHADAARGRFDEESARIPR
jgi:hypothetical protein